MSCFKKNRRKILDATILKAYRFEARRNLNFIGGWSGYWVTRIDGVDYISERVSSFRYSVYGEAGCGWFLHNAIIDRIQLRCNSKEYERYQSSPIFNRERLIESEFDLFRDKLKN